jgi:hypothetical protein
VTYTNERGTDTGLIRLLIPDRVQGEAIFQDEEIADFLALEASVVKRAAALALESIASDQALVLKVLKLDKNQTDGAKLSDALLKRAALLRKQAAEEAAGEIDGDGLFDIAEQVVDVFGEREYLYNEALRNG